MGAASFLRVRVQRLRNLRKTVRHRHLHRAGNCTVCGRPSRFLAHGTNLKESLHCVRCGAWTRVRWMAEVLVQLYAREGATSLRELVREPGFRTLAMHEAQASGPLHEVLVECPHYGCSEYLAGVPPGSTSRGVRCEDLQALTLPDASLDLLLHASVLEHLPRPELALREAARVLKPGGRLVFEVPMTDPGEPGIRAHTVVRVDSSTGRAVFLKEPVHHDDPLSPEGILVHTDFGADLTDLLRGLGFRARLEVLELSSSSMSHAVVVVAERPGGDEAPGPASF